MSAAATPVLIDCDPGHDDAMAMRPQLFETPPRWVEVDTASELCRGRTAVPRRAPDERPANARVATGVDAEAVLELLVSRISSLA